MSRVIVENDWWPNEGYGGGSGRLPTREAAEARAKDDERLGFGAGDGRRHGRIHILHYIREETEWQVSPETEARIAAEDEAADKKRKKR